MSLRRPVSTGAYRADCVTLLSVFLLALFAIESRLVIAPLGGTGQPAQLIALAGLGWWIYYQVQRPDATGVGAQPVRLALALVVAAFTLSYIVAMSRPITTAEGSLANLGMVVLLGWVGVAVLANDGVQSRDRFEVLVGRLVLGGALLALLGVAQFVSGRLLVDHLQIPGLVTNLSEGQLLARAGFSRPSGTALHPIEFGAVLTMTLPLAITRARLAAGNPVRAWVPSLLIGFGILLSGSRSALLCALVALVVLGADWSPRARRQTAASVVVLLGVVALTIPGMLGTLLHLFSRVGGDASIASRTDSYSLATELVHSAPWLGRGFKTFTPDYRILDNQYLDLLIEVGVVGLVAVLALFIAGICCAQLARRRAEDLVLGAYGQALTASIVAGALGLGMYDGFSFRMGAAVLFLVLGLAGGLWRLARAGAPPDLEAERAPVAVPAPEEPRQASRGVGR